MPRVDEHLGRSTALVLKFLRAAVFLRCELSAAPGLPLVPTRCGLGAPCRHLHERRVPRCPGRL